MKIIKAILKSIVKSLKAKDKVFSVVIRKGGDRLMALVKKRAVAKLVGLLASKIPFLATGPLGWIAGWAIGWITGKVLKVLFEVTETGLIFWEIEHRVDKQNKRYIEAEERFDNAKTKEEKKAAQQEVDDSFDEFISLVK